MGLFDRLFGQEKQEEQVALVEEVETEQSASSEDTVTTVVESASQEKEEIQSEVVESELTAEQEAQKQRTLDMMAQYYATKEAAAARVKEAQEQGFDPAIQTKVKEKPGEEVVPVEQESEQDKYQRTLKRPVQALGQGSMNSLPISVQLMKNFSKSWKKC